MAAQATSLWRFENPTEQTHDKNIHPFSHPGRAPDSCAVRFHAFARSPGPEPARRLEGPRHWSRRRGWPHCRDRCRQQRPEPDRHWRCDRRRLDFKQWRIDMETGIRRPASGLDRCRGDQPVQSGYHLGRHRGRQSAQLHLDRRRPVQVHRRRSQLGPGGSGKQRTDQPHHPAPGQARYCLRGGAGHPVGTQRGTWRL